MNGYPSSGTGRRAVIYTFAGHSPAERTATYACDATALLSTCHRGIGHPSILQIRPYLLRLWISFHPQLRNFAVISPELFHLLEGKAFPRISGNGKRSFGSNVLPLQTGYPHTNSRLALLHDGLCCIQFMLFYYLSIQSYIS